MDEEYGHFNFEKDVAISDAKLAFDTAVLLEYMELIGWQKGIIAWHRTGNFKPYDLRLEHPSWLRNIMVEVKNDMTAKRTGNVFIEFEDRGKPSGISTTTSDLYLYVCGPVGFRRWFVVSTLALRKIINQNKWKCVPGGDDYLARGYLIPMHSAAFIDNFKEIKSEKPWQLRQPVEEEVVRANR